MKKVVLVLTFLSLAAAAVAQDTAPRPASPAPARPRLFDPARSAPPAPVRGRDTGPRRPGPGPGRPSWNGGAYTVLDVGGLLDVVLHGRAAWPTGPVPPRPVAYGPVDYYRPGPASGRVGLKAGFNLATVAGGGAPGKFTYRDGFSTGAMADFALNRCLSVHPELLFSQKGARYDEAAASGARFAGKLRLSYFDLPLLLRARAPSGVFVEVGPQLGYLVGQKTESIEYVPGQSPRATTRADMAGTRRLDLGYVADVGYQLPQGLEISARYNGGLADLNDPSDGPALRNVLVQLQVGYLFK